MEDEGRSSAYLTTSSIPEPTKSNGHPGSDTESNFDDSHRSSWRHQEVSSTDDIDYVQPKDCTENNEVEPESGPRRPSADHIYSTIDKKPSIPHVHYNRNLDPEYADIAGVRPTPVNGTSERKFSQPDIPAELIKQSRRHTWILVGLGVCCMVLIVALVVGVAVLASTGQLRACDYGNWMPWGCDSQANKMIRMRTVVTSDHCELEPYLLIEEGGPCTATVGEVQLMDRETQPPF